MSEPTYRVLLPDGKRTKPFTKSKIAVALADNRIPATSEIDVDGERVNITLFCAPEPLAAREPQLRPPPLKADAPKRKFPHRWQKVAVLLTVGIVVFLAGRASLEVTADTPPPAEILPPATPFEPLELMVSVPRFFDGWNLSLKPLVFSADRFIDLKPNKHAADRATTGVLLMEHPDGQQQFIPVIAYITNDTPPAVKHVQFVTLDL